MTRDPNAFARGADTDRSIGELFADLARETSTLVRQEVQLATAEMAAKAARAGALAGTIGAGGALLHAALLALVASAVLGLGAVVPMWLSALVIGLVVAVAGYALVRSGIGGLARIDPSPRQTIETLEEDKRWLEKRMK